MFVFTVIFMVFLRSQDALSQAVPDASQRPPVGSGVYDSSKFLSDKALFHAQSGGAAASDYTVCERTAYLTNPPDLSRLKDDLSNVDALVDRFSRMGGSLVGALGAGAAGEQALGTSVDFAFGGGATCGPLQGESKSTDCGPYKIGVDFKPELVDEALVSLLRADDNASCHMLKSAKAAALSKCFSRQFDQLREVMRDTKADFDKELGKIKEYTTDINEAVQNKEQEMGTLETKIQSIDGVLSKAEALINKVSSSVKLSGSGSSQTADPSNLGGLKLRLSEHEALQDSFVRDQKLERVNRAAECLVGRGTASSAFAKCPDSSGDLTTPYDCILRLFEEQVAQGLTDVQSRKIAHLERKKFEQRLQQLLGEVRGRNPRFLSISGFLNQYKSELTSYGSVGQSMMRELQQCDTQTESDIKRDLLNTDTALGRRALALSQASTVLASEMGAMVLDLDRGVRDVAREAYGDELGAALTSSVDCRNVPTISNSPNEKVNFQPATLQTQYRCARILNDSLEALVLGTPAPGYQKPVVTKLGVPGSDGQPAVCAGLRKCRHMATQLMGEAGKRMTALKGDGTFSGPPCRVASCEGLKRFARNANKYIRDNILAVRDVLKQRVLVAKGIMERVNQLLGGSSGLDFPAIDPKTVDFESLCPTNDENPQVCSLPADFETSLARLAGVPDFEAEHFNSMKDQAQEKEEEARDIAKSVRENIRNLKVTKIACAEKSFEEKAGKKLAGAKNTFNVALDEICRGGVRAVQVNPGKTPDNDKVFEGLRDRFSTRIARLQSDISKICEDPDFVAPEACQSLSEDMYNYRQLCSTAFNDALEKKLERIRGIAALEAVGTQSK